MFLASRMQWYTYSAGPHRAATDAQNWHALCGSKKKCTTTEGSLRTYCPRDLQGFHDFLCIQNGRGYCVSLRKGCRSNLIFLFLSISEVQSFLEVSQPSNGLKLVWQSLLSSCKSASSSANWQIAAYLTNGYFILPFILELTFETLHHIFFLSK